MTQIKERTPDSLDDRRAELAAEKRDDGDIASDSGRVAADDPGLPGEGAGGSSAIGGRGGPATGCRTGPGARTSERA